MCEIPNALLVTVGFTLFFRIPTTNISYRFTILKLPPPPCAVLLVSIIYTVITRCCTVYDTEAMKRSKLVRATPRNSEQPSGHHRFRIPRVRKLLEFSLGGEVLDVNGPSKELGLSSCICYHYYSLLAQLAPSTVYRGLSSTHLYAAPSCSP